jgi:hypothetical protein
MLTYRLQSFAYAPVTLNTERFLVNSGIQYKKLDQLAIIALFLTTVSWQHIMPEEPAARIAVPPGPSRVDVLMDPILSTERGVCWPIVHRHERLQNSFTMYHVSSDWRCVGVPIPNEPVAVSTRFRRANHLRISTFELFDLTKARQERERGEGA